MRIERKTIAVLNEGIKERDVHISNNLRLDIFYMDKDDIMLKYFKYDEIVKNKNDSKYYKEYSG